MQLPRLSEQQGRHQRTPDQRGRRHKPPEHPPGQPGPRGGPLDNRCCALIRPDAAASHTKPLGIPPHASTTVPHGLILGREGGQSNKQVKQPGLSQACHPPSPHHPGAILHGQVPCLPVPERCSQREMEPGSEGRPRAHEGMGGGRLWRTSWGWCKLGRQGTG